VAAGASWVAAVTSQRMLRVFSHAGSQRQMVSLHGAPVTCAGKVDTHALNPNPEPMTAHIVP